MFIVVVFLFTYESAIPWIPKFAYGMITDAIPIFGYRRKPYLFASGAIICFFSFQATFWTKSLNDMKYYFFAVSAGLAVSDAVVDAITVERCEFP